MKRLFWTSLKNSIITCLQLRPSQKGLSAQENEHLNMEQPFHPQLACFQVGTCVHLREKVLLKLMYSFLSVEVLMTLLITRY